MLLVQMASGDNAASRRRWLRDREVDKMTSPRTAGVDFIEDCGPLSAISPCVILWCSVHGSLVNLTEPTVLVALLCKLVL